MSSVFQVRPGAFMIQLDEISWWGWAVSAALLVAGVAGWPLGLPLALGLGLVQVIAFMASTRSLAAFPVQVRLAYLAILALSAWPRLQGLVWLPLAGTLAQVLFGYCLLARTLSLAPWNRRAPLSPDLIRRTFLSPPVRGDILQGQPAPRPRR